MLEDTFESMDDQEEMEEAAEMEIDKILFEITAGMTPRVSSFSPPFMAVLPAVTKLSSSFFCRLELPYFFIFNFRLCKLFLES